MFKNIKDLRNVYKNIEKDTKIICNEDNQIILNVSLNDESEILSPFSLKNEPIITSELDDYLHKKIIPSYLKSDLNIHFSVLNEKDTSKYEKAFKLYYQNALLEDRRAIRFNIIAAILMALTAVVVFMVSILIKDIKSSILLESINIAGWVFMWEAVDQYFISRKVNKIKQLKNYKLYKAKITFQHQED